MFIYTCQVAVSSRVLKTKPVWWLDQKKHEPTISGFLRVTASISTKPEKLYKNNVFFFAGKNNVFSREYDPKT
jgi:hypothetical protein